MTLFIIGFALLLGLIIALEVKSRKREKESSFRTENIIKESCNDYRGRSLDDVKNIRQEIARDSAMLYIKGVDEIVPKKIIEAKERGYFDKIFIHNGRQYKFERFGQIRYDLISIIAKTIGEEPNNLACFKIYENGYFIWFDFVKDEQSIDIFSIQKRLKKIVDDLCKSLLTSDSFSGSVKASERLKGLLDEIRKSNHEKTN